MEENKSSLSDPSLSSQGQGRLGKNFLDGGTGPQEEVTPSEVIDLGKRKHMWLSRSFFPGFTYREEASGGGSVRGDEPYTEEGLVHTEGKMLRNHYRLR